MAARCSRGAQRHLFVLFLRPTCQPPSILRTVKVPQSQSFHFFSPCRYAQPKTAIRSPKSTPTPRQKPSATTKTAPPRTAVPSSYALIKELSRRGSPTILYQAPSHFWLQFGAWSTAVFCFTYSGYNLMTTYANPPPGLPWFVTPMTAITCVAMSCLGTYFLLRSKNLVKTVRAMPLAPTRAPAANPTYSGKLPAIELEISIKPLIPFLPTNVIRVPYTEVSLGSRITVPFEPVSATERIQRTRAEQEEAAKKRQYELDHLYSAPFRHANSGIRAMFRGLRQSLTGSGFGSLRVKDESYKLDVTHGWMLDGGRSLEMLVQTVGVDGREESKWEKMY